MKSVIRDTIKSTKFDGVCALKTYFNFSENFTKDIWNDSVFNDEVRTERIPLKYLLKDPSATSYHTSSWIAHEVEDTVDNIASKFNIKDKKDITVCKSSEYSTSITSEDKSDFQYGKYYEIEDRRNETIFYLVDGIDYIVQGPEEKKYKYDTMYDFLMYNDIPDDADPQSDYEFWRQQYLEVNRLRSMINKHARKGVAKYKWMGPEPTEEQIKAAQSSEDSAVINLGAGQDIAPIQHAPIDPNIFQALNLASADIQLISKNAPRQIVGQDKTATEVKAVEAASQEVSSESLERLEEVIQSIANKWAMLMQDNYTATRVIALTEMADGEFVAKKNTLGDLIEGDKKNPYLRISKDDLQGTIQAKVKAGSTAPENDQARIAKLTNFMKIVGTVPGMIGAIDKEELLNELVDAFDLRSDNLIIRKDNPMEESRLLNSGVFMPAKLSEDHDKHLSIHERESNNSDQNILHILMHKQFKQQLEENRKAMAASQISKMNDPITGTSFVGGMPNIPQGPLPPAIQPNPSGVMPMGGAAPVARPPVIPPIQ